MTLREALHRAAKALDAQDIPDARLEAELLAMAVLGIDRARLYTLLPEELSENEAAALNELLERRLKREPAAYIRASREFFGLEFYVDQRVLIPRPETELLVERAIEYVTRRFPDGGGMIADIGTGSGAIAISLAKHLPKARIYAIDISPKALEVASLNCRRHSVSVRLLEGDLLEPLPEPVDLIVANLPYVAEEEMLHLHEEIRLYEPGLALEGGPDGLEVVRRLLKQAPAKLRPGGAVMLEIGSEQGEVVLEAAGKQLPEAEIKVCPDLAGLDRLLVVET